MLKKAVLTGIIVALLLQAAAAGASPVTSITAEIDNLSRDIDASQKEIGNLDSQLETTTKDIIHTYQKLDAQEASLHQQKRALNIRLNEVYKNYDELMISIFLDAHSFSDIWKRFNFLAKINQADTELLAANKLRLDQVRQLKLELARKKQEQVDLKRRKQTEYLLLQSSLLQKKVLLEAKLREAEEAAAARAAQAAQAAPAVQAPAPAQPPATPAAAPVPPAAP